MGIEYIYFVGAVFVGIGAALIMDLWNVFLRRAFNISSLNFCLVGRWLSHMLLGTLQTRSDCSSSEKTGRMCNRLARALPY